MPAWSRYNSSLEMQPDILLSYENDKNRVFTLHLRPGHKWSDGTPFTAEDFRFQWEDMLIDKDMDRGGLDSALSMPAARAPKFEVIDRLTVRYTWEDAQSAVPAGPGRRAAARYLQRLRLPQAVPCQIRRRRRRSRRRSPQEKVKNWQALQIRKGRSYRSENPDLPTLQPWLNLTNPPANRFVFERNPYYHKVDQNGVQLPYVDQLVMNIAESSIIPGQDGVGRVRPAGALSQLRRLHLPQGRREAQQLHGQALDRRQRLGRGACFPT